MSFGVAQVAVDVRYVHWADRQEIERTLRSCGARDVRHLRQGLCQAILPATAQAAFYEAIAARPADEGMRDGLTLFGAVWEG